jgi:hypothetical protein
MAAKPLRCRLGMHAFVSEHPTDERFHGPDNKVCRLCGKHPTDVGGIPPAALGGGGPTGI